MKFAVVYSPEIKETNLAISRRLIGFERALEKYGIKHIPAEKYDFDERILYEVHSREMVEKVRRFFASSSSFKSVWAVSTAAKMMRNYDVIIVPTSGTGHNATRESFKGYSFLNDVNIAIKVLRDSGFERIAIIDTDSHHGEGVFQYVAYDPDIMYICFCNQNRQSKNGRKLCLRAEDDEHNYLQNFEKIFQIVESFSPEVLIWYVGQDAHESEYSELNLSSECFMEILKMIKREWESKKILIILSGGTRDDTTEEISTMILKSLIKN